MVDGHLLCILTSQAMVTTTASYVRRQHRLNPVHYFATGYRVQRHAYNAVGADSQSGNSSRRSLDTMDSLKRWHLRTVLMLLSKFAGIEFRLSGSNLAMVFP